jgi:hypothetical protein
MKRLSILFACLLSMSVMADEPPRRNSTDQAVWVRVSNTNPSLPPTLVYTQPALDIDYTDYMVVIKREANRPTEHVKATPFNYVPRTVTR